LWVGSTVGPAGSAAGTPRATRGVEPHKRTIWCRATRAIGGSLRHAARTKSEEKLDARRALRRNCTRRAESEEECLQSQHRPTYRRSGLHTRAKVSPAS